MRHRFLRVSLAALALTVAAVSVARPADRGAEQKRWQQQVQALFDKLIAADRAGDAATVASCYEDQGMLLPPTGAPVKGREEIRKRYEAMFATASLDVTMKSEELWVFEDWAISRGTTTGQSVSKAQGGAPRAVHDKYLMVLKRDGGEWVIHNLMWSPMN